MYYSYHIDFVVIHKYTDTEQEGEQQLVLLKERTTNIAVQTECKVFIDVDNTLLKVICNGGGEVGERERERVSERDESTPLQNYVIRNIPDCSAEAIELRKILIYHSSEYWYMGSMLDRSVVQKKSS